MAAKKNKTKASRGRPRKIETPEEFERLTEAYLANCKANERPITLTGAIRHLGLSSRSTLDGYLEYEGFSEPVKKLKLIVEQAYEERLHGTSPTGAIFALKNMGWSDRQEIAHSGEVKGGVMAVPVAMEPKAWAEAAKEHQSRITSE